MVVHEVYLAADDRLDTVPGARLVQLHRTVHHAMVGQPQGGLLELRSAFGERLDLAGAVEQGVLGVHVQVGAGGLGHRSAS